MPGDIVKTINYKKEYVCVPEGHCWIEGDKLVCFFNIEYEIEMIFCLSFV